MARRTLRQIIKDLFTGGKSTSNKSQNSKSSGNVKKASGGYYGGGHSSSYRSSGNSSREDEKEKQRQKSKEQNRLTTAKFAEIAKMSQHTDALSSGKKVSPPKPKEPANKGVDRAVKKIGEKSTFSDPKVEAARALKERRDRAHAEGKSLIKEDLNELKNRYEKEREAYHEATGHRYDVGEEGISKEEKAKRRRAQKSRMYDLDAELYETEVHPTASSFGRGVLSGVTLGASELALQKSKARQESGAEEFYQTHKNRGAEIAGTFAGGLLSYGGTAGAFENLGAQAVGRAASTQVGRRLGAEALQRTMAGEGFKAAIARSLVGDAIQDSTMGLFDTMTDVARRDDLETAGDYAKAVAQGQVLNYGMGLAGNGLMHGLPAVGGAARNAWGNFVDESRRLYAVPKGIAEAGEEIGGNINKATGIDLSKGHTEEERAILKSRYNEVKAQANKLEAVSSSADPVDRANFLMAAESLRAEAGAIEGALKRNVGEPAKFVDVEAIEAERAAKKAAEAEERAKNAELSKEPIEPQGKAEKTPEEKQKAQTEKRKRERKNKAESEERKRMNKEAEELTAKLSEQASSKDGVVASGKNLRTGEKLEFWKENGNLYVGNPNGKYQSFGRDIPENRIKAEDEFDYLNYTKKQRFKEARKKAERAEAKAKAAKEKPARPSNVSYFSDKELKAMEKNKDFSKLTKAEYEYYFPNRKIELDFGGDEEAVAKGVKSKEAQDNLEELILEGKESRTFTKNQLEKKVSKSNKRLAELEEQIKKNSNASQWTQDKLSAQYESQLSYNKRIRELLEQAKNSEDGKVTTYRNKSNYVKKAAEEPEVTTTKTALEPKGKKKGGKRKGKKTEEPKVETEAKAEEPKAEVEAPKETKPKKTKAEKEIEKLQNKVNFAETKVKNAEKELKKRRKEGASEGSIKYWEDYLANEKANRKALKAELRKAKKELGVESKPQDVALKEGGKEPPKPTKAEATETPKPEDFEAPTSKQIKKLENQIANAENNIRRFDEAIEKKKADGATEKSIAWSENAKAREVAKKEGFEAELADARKALEAEAKSEAPFADDHDLKVLRQELADTEKQLEATKARVADIKENKPDVYATDIYDNAKADVDTLTKEVESYKQEIADREAELKNSTTKPQDKALKDNGKKPPKAKKGAETKEKAKAPTLNEDGYASVDESPFESTATKAKKGNKSKSNKGVKEETVQKLNKAKGRFVRQDLPRGERLHKGVVRRVTGKPLDETAEPQTVEQMLDGLKRWADGQASDDTEVVSLAGIKLQNATTDEFQRARLSDIEANDKFNYSRIRNDQKYEEAYREIRNNFDAVAKRLQGYEADMTTLPVSKMVDTHYEAHAMMKYLRKELSNPDLSPEQLKNVQAVYDASACLTQRLASISGQTNQFQGVMVACSPQKRMKNAAENIVDILDSSRGFRKKTLLEDGTRLAEDVSKRRQQIRKLVYNDKDIFSALEKVGKASTEEEYGEAMEELLLKAYKLNKSTAFDYLQQWRYLSMLGNPRTHFRNILGNITFGTIRKISNAVRSSLEKGFEGYAIKHNLEMDMHGGISANALKQAQSERFVTDDAGKSAWESFNKRKKEILGAQKFDSPQMTKFYNALTEGNSKALAAEDDFFRGRAYRETYIKSYNKYAKKGEITEEVLKKIHEIALKESQIATFNEFSELAQLLAKSQRGLYDANASTRSKAVAMASNALLPFTKVPANILKQSVNYSPVGVFKGIAHIKDAAKTGNSELFNKALDEFASGLTGTGVAALGYWFGSKTDLFTTNAGSEDAAAQFKKRQGVQNYSVLINGKDGKQYSMTLDWLLPISSTFFMGVETANQFKNGLKGANLGDFVGNLSQVTSRVIDPVLETSMLSSIYNIVENSRKSSSYDDQKSFADIVVREMVQSYLSSYVPTLQGQIARTAYDSDKFVTGDDDWEYWFNSMKYKMGLANTDVGTDRLGADVDAYGEIKNKKETGADYAKSFLKNAVIPANIQEVDLTDVDKEKIKEYEDYVKAGGDPADKDYLFPKKQYRKNFTFGKKGADPMKIDLTNEQVSLYNQAKTSGGAEAMRVALEGAMFNHYDKDSSGKRSILKNGYTKEQKEELIRQFEGKSMREVEQWLYKQPQFRSATEEEQRKVLNAMWSYSQSGKAQGAKRVGEQAVIKAQGGDLDQYNFKNELSKTKQLALQEAVDSGIVTYAEAVDFARNAGKTYYYDNDEGGSSSTYYNKKQMIEYLQSKGYSYEKAEALYNAFKASNAKDYNGSGSSSGGRGGYRGRRSGGRGGSSAKAKVPAPKTISASKLIKGQALVSKNSSSSSRSSVPTLKRVEAKIDLPTDKYTKKNRR